MPRVKVNSEKLYERGTKFNSLLSPLLSNPQQGGPGWKGLSLGRKVVFAAYQTNPTLDFTEWRFNTFIPGFKAQYYEIWIPTDLDKQEEWYLKQAYLNIYSKDNEYVCLHCDPEEEDTNDQKSCYKKSPHIHIKVAYEPIPKAHIALAHGFIENILSTEDDLFSAMRLGIELITDEILKRLIE